MSYNLHVMVTPADFSVTSCWLSAFVRVPLEPNRLPLSNLQTFYDGELFVFPLPPEVPSEIPSVILKTADGRQRIEISRSTVTCRWDASDPSENVKTRVIEEVAEHLAQVVELTNADVGRIGGVMERVSASSDPGPALAKQFCRPELLSGPLNRPEGFELHAHKAFSMASVWEVNSWIRIRAGKSAAHGSYDRVLVQQDINTLAEHFSTRAFSGSDVRGFAAACAGEFETVLYLYFQPKAMMNADT